MKWDGKETVERITLESRRAEELEALPPSELWDATSAASGSVTCGEAGYRPGHTPSQCHCCLL
jgi:hypothetical protein